MFTSAGPETSNARSNLFHNCEQSYNKEELFVTKQHVNQVCIITIIITRLLLKVKSQLGTYKPQSTAFMQPYEQLN